MSARTFHLEEEKLKDYILLVMKIGELAPDKLEYLVNKIEKSTDPEEKTTLKRLLVEFFLKFVISIAVRYRGAGLSFSNLIRLGNRGLITAVKKWEKAEDENFISHITWKIEGAMIDGVIRKKKKAVQKNG